MDALGFVPLRSVAVGEGEPLAVVGRVSVTYPAAAPLAVLPAPFLTKIRLPSLNFASAPYWRARRVTRCMSDSPVWAMIFSISILASSLSIAGSS